MVATYLRIKRSDSDGEDDSVSEDCGELVKYEEGAYTLWALSQSQTFKIHTSAEGSPYFDVLLERFIDNFAPSSPTGIDCGNASALRSAGELSVFSPLLKHAFMAASALYFGCSVQDWRFVAASTTLYTGVLKHLQQALYHPEQSRSEGVLATVVVLMAYETLRSMSENGLLVHCYGAMQLIQFRGPYSHKYGVEHSIFTEMLPYWVTIAISSRKPTFLAEEEWKTIPWSGGVTSKDIMAALMERMVDLPGILYQSDELERMSSDVASSDAKRAQLWLDIEDLENRLWEWKVEWVDNYPAGQVIAHEFQTRDSFPVFQFRDLITGEIITPLPFAFPDPQLARVLCFYYASMILLCSSGQRPAQHSRRHEQFAFACLICRSMKYFINSVPGNMVNRMILPLSVAQLAFPMGGIERAFVAQVSGIIQTKRNLTSWDQLLDSLGLRAE